VANKVGRFFSALSLCALASSTCARQADAQTETQAIADFYQGRTITVIVGSDVGGGYDLTARTVARHLGRHLPGSPSIIVQNKPGASSIVASNYVYELAPKDGTVIAAVQRPIPLQILFGDTGVRFDVQQIQWIGSTSNEVGVVVAWRTAPQRTVDDLFRSAMIVGGTGPATDPELIARAMNNVLGTKFKIVSGYRGQSQMALAMEREEIQGSANWSFSDIDKGHPDWIADGRIRILLQLALTKSQNPALRDIPFILDIARTEDQRRIFEILMGMKAMGRPYFVAPTVPKDRSDALRTAFMETMRDPHFLADAEKTLGAIDPLSGPAMQKVIASVYALPPALVARAREIVKVPGAD
jgi:tripartite-type tricarboxylate transporter receptor subunit TctC